MIDIKVLGVQKVNAIYFLHEMTPKVVDNELVWVSAQMILSSAVFYHINDAISYSKLPYLGRVPDGAVYPKVDFKRLQRALEDV
jgi:hypothetical protein